jgi:tetratricopeptide (TPR) repeat protein
MMKGIYVFAILIFILAKLCNATEKAMGIDSLEMIISNYKEGQGAYTADTTAVNAFVDVAMYFKNSAPEKANLYLNNALRISKAINYEKGICNAFSALANIEMEKGLFADAFVKIDSAHKIAKRINYTKGIETYPLNMYRIYYFQARYPAALKYLIEAARLAEKGNDPEQLALCYYYAGVLNNIMKNYNDAINNLNSSAKIYESRSDLRGIAQTSAGLGNAYLGKKDYDKALNYFSRASSYSDDANDKNGVATAYNSMGRVYLYLEQYEKAINFTNHALDIYTSLDNKNGIASCYNTMGRIYTRTKKYELARKYLNDAISLTLESGRLNSLQNNYLQLSVLDSAEGNYRSAYYNYKNYFLYHDSIYNQENTQNLTQQKMEFLFDRKRESDSLAFAYEKELDAVKLHEQRLMTMGGFGASILTAFLLFFVYVNYKKQKRANRELKEAQHQLILSEKMAAFGVMASRVSHEIQNPLNFVNNFSSVSKDLVKEVLLTQDEEDRKHCADLLLMNLDKIQEHGKKAAAIVNQLQEHDRKGTAHEFFESDD